jgi:hypothetical protein
MKHYKVKGAKMSYVVTMGQAFDSKRAETFDTMQQVLQGNPQLMNVVGDILFRNYDGAGADQIADRLKKMLPPQLQSADDQQIPPQAQAAISQLQQQGQALNAHAQILEKQLGQLQYEKQAKVVELQGRLQEIAAKHQADMELEDKKLLAQLAVAEISTKAQIATERQGAVNDLEAQLHEQAHELGMQKDEQAHAQDMAQQQAEQAQQMQAQQAEQQAQQPQDNS